MALRISGEDLGAEDIEGLKGVVEGIENTWTQEGNPPTRSVKESDSEGFAGPSVPHTQGRHEAPRCLSPCMVDCVACGDAFQLSGLVRCPCGDLYCPECLKSLFVRATTDEALFPPRCCRQTIPLSAIESELSDESLSNFNSAAIEFSTTNRTYCVRTDCGKFIPPDHIHSSRAVCLHCRAETCAHCKGALHSGDCPKDQALQALLTLAEEERWRRCFGCNAMVELNTGCNHITCKCSAQFCYTCGVQWKNCTCEIWEERNLLGRAEQVVDREADYPIAAPERHRRVVEIRRELQANHECDHPGRWERQEGYRRRGYKCEICDARHWKYILRCRHCHLVACEECRRHRV
ncbi:ariadne RING finger [Acephala macrosclerotiorum]|nr:ariadne RING finger [Acephala macrosclerotiorum]